MDMEDLQTVDMRRLYDLPDELWAEILERVARPSDLLHAMLACKRFYHYARLPLYHIVHYRSPRRMERNAVFLARRPTYDPLLVATKAVIVSGELGRGLRPASREHLRITSLLLDLGSQRNGQNPSPYNTLHSLLQTTFAPTLTKLVFIGANIPASFFKLLPTLPHLRRLYLHSSSPEAHINSYRNLSVWHPSGSGQDSQAFNLPVLPHLVELRAWRLEWFDPHRHPHVLSYIDTIDIVRVAPNLHTLWIDWSSIISGRLLSSDFDHLTLSLRILHLRFPPLPTHSHHEYEEEEHEDSRASENLARFLRRCENLEELVIAGIVASDTYKHERRGLGLQRLKVYHGPLDFLLFVAGTHTNQLEAITISTVALPRSRSEYGRWETEAQVFCTMLRRLDSPALRELNFSCHEWNNELIFCVVKCFPSLSTLRIAFLHGDIEEGELLSLGAIHLTNLTNLTTLHLYRHLNQRRIVPQHQTSSVFLSTVNSGDFSRIQQQADMMLQSIGVSSSVRDAGECCAEPESPLADPEDIKEVLAGWRKHTVNLNEVRLTAGGVWTRGRVIYSDAELLAMPQKVKGRVFDTQGRAWGEWRMREVSPSEVDAMWFDAELEKRRELRAFM